jgi:hypothetical protein
MSRLTLGAVHSVKLNSPAHTWFVIFYYEEEDCVEEYMLAELYTTVDTTTIHLLVHIKLVHVSRQVLLSIVHLDFPQLKPSNYNYFAHCHCEASSALPTLSLPSLSPTRFRSLQPSLAIMDAAFQQVMVLASNLLTTRFESCATGTTIRVKLI